MIVASLCLIGPGLRAEHQHHAAKSKRRHMVSAQEARAARLHKIALANRLHNLHSHMHAVKSKIHVAKAKENTIHESITTVEARLQTTRARINRVNTRLQKLEHDHDVITARLETTQERLKKRRQLLGARIRDNYALNQITYARVLLEASSLHDMLSREVYVRQIVKSDAALIASVKQDIQQIQQDKQALETQAKEAKQLAAEYETQKSQYASDLVRKQELLRTAQTARALAEDELDDLESDAEAMSDRIRELSAVLEQRRQAEEQIARDERISRAQARRRARIATNRRTQLPDETQDPDASPEPIPHRKISHGDFIKPCDGPITSNFGYRFHPILHRRRLHSGVDIGAPSGAAIHAAGNGTVIMASFSSGYGNCVIIDHGGGVTTLYGHCSVLLVSEGQEVSQGQLIARVGATGLATGPHLHFEVRHNGTPVQPF